ncbi:hypothetical protein BH24ACT5_BH24ACT5_22410 [soil metagenome]
MEPTAAPDLTPTPTAKRRSMPPKRARALLAACLLVSGGSIAVARNTTAEDIAPPRTFRPAAVRLPIIEDSAPPITASGWINTQPLESVDLLGKVVLYDFWTFGCINCQHTLPYVQAWHERYADDGLLIIGIHTPEFDYERDPDAVAAFVEDNGLTYPIALDPDKVTWRAFGNHYWPRFYLHDIVGRRRYEHIGEGRYDETEDAIRFLLGVDPDSPRADVPT